MIVGKRIEHTEELSSDQYAILQEKLKLDQKEIMHKFYRQFSDKLNAAKEKNQAKLLFDDLVSMKYNLNEEDYKNGLAASTNKPESFQELLKTFEVTDSVWRGEKIGLIWNFGNIKMIFYL